MSPMNPDELRAELLWTQANAPAPDADLAASIIARGHRTQRRNRIVASVAALAVLAGGGYGVSTLWRPTQEAIPIGTPSASPTPTATMSETPSSGPSPSGTPQASVAPSALPSTTQPPSFTPTWGTRPPASFGELGAFRLRHEGVGADGEQGAWTPSVWEVRCGDSPVLPLQDAVAGRRIASTGPVGVEDESILVFRDEDAARAFMSWHSRTWPRCNAPAPDPDQPWLHFAISSLSSLGDEALVARVWEQGQSDGQWVNRPGGTITLLVRSGRAVVSASTSGEYVGDQYHTDPSIIADLRRTADHALPQMCGWTSRGC